jgi:hypothetical protein
MEALTNFFEAVGTVKQVYTEVDFYSYVKTVEYMICVAFFIVFPRLYRRINSDRKDHDEKHAH